MMKVIREEILFYCFGLGVAGYCSILPEAKWSLVKSFIMRDEGVPRWCEAVHIDLKLKYSCYSV